MAITAPGNFSAEKNTVYPGGDVICTWTPSTGDFVGYKLDVTNYDTGEWYIGAFIDPTATSYPQTIPESIPIGTYLKVALKAYKSLSNDESEPSSVRVQVVAPESENPPIPGSEVGWLEQLQNSEEENLYPRTILEGIFRQSDGKSLEELLATLAESSSDINLELPLSIQNGGTGHDTATYGLAALISALGTTFPSSSYSDVYVPVCVGDKSYKVPLTSIQKWTVGDRSSSASQATSIYNAYIARGIAASMTDLAAGSSALLDGAIYVVYE